MRLGRVPLTGAGTRSAGPAPTAGGPAVVRWTGRDRWEGGERDDRRGREEHTASTSLVHSFKLSVYTKPADLGRILPR